MRTVVRLCSVCNEKQVHEFLEDGLTCTECGHVQEGSIQSSKQVTAWTEPLLSDAAGVHPDQIPEVQARFPHHEFTSDGRMVFRSKTQRRRILKEIGMVDKDDFN